MGAIRELSNLDRAELVALVHQEQAQGRLEPARMLCLLGLTRFPHSSELLTLLGWIQSRSGDLAGAESSFRQALCRGAATASTHGGLAAALALAGNYAAAEIHYQEALALDDQDPQTWFNAGCTKLALGKFHAAIDAFRAAIRLDPQMSDAHHNLGVALNKIGCWETAIASCNEALARVPGAWQIRLVRAMARLALGIFADGWEDYEARIESADYCPSLLGVPAWRGPGDRRRSIVVVPEQGVGTQLMFASCLEDLVAHVPRRTLACDPRLITLFRRSFPSIEIVADGLLPLLARNGDFDCYAMAGSLPKFFRPSRQSFPGTGYLAAGNGTRKKWAARLRALGNGYKIGISWRGGSFRSDSRHRCTTLADWQPLVDLPNVHWINLQYDAQPAELESWRAACGGRFHDCSDLDKKHDFENTAALVAELDLVISVVNSTVHLAGGLGVPTWTLVPIGGEWRWQATGENCLWHDSVRLFRQRHFGDWTHVFDDVGHALSAWIAGTASVAA
jgi:tetratricopeptide (TPR) repeat protein